MIMVINDQKSIILQIDHNTKKIKTSKTNIILISHIKTYMIAIHQ